MSQDITELEAATEGSSYPVSVSMTDSAGSAMTPSSCTWSLYNQSGAVVNSRLNVTMTPSTAMTIVLLAADLDASDSDYNCRILTIKAVYTSTYGTGLTLNKEYKIPIIPVVGA
jgi:hypothetical protein